MTSTAASNRLRPVPDDAATIAVAVAERTVRARIAAALRGQAGITVRVGDGADKPIDPTSPDDLLVLHLASAASDEVRFVTELKREVDGLLIVVVCNAADGRGARRVIDAGADGLVFADRLEAVLRSTIAAVLAGQIVVPRELRTGVRKPSLSNREKQVLAMVVMGFSNSEIGARLFLAESTVKSHLSSAFGKLGVRSRHEAAALILDPHGSLGTGILAITGERSANRPE